MIPRRTLARSLRAIAVISALVAPLLVSTVTARSAAAAVTAGEADQFTWSVAPGNDGTPRTHFDYASAAGSIITDGLAVVNRSSTPITLNVYASDAFITSTGAIDLLPAAQKPVDVGSWVKVEKPQITLAPQESTIVPFTLTIPANATPGDHSGGVVTSLATTTGTGAVSLDRRLGSRLYLRVPGALNPALKVDGVKASYDGTINPVSSGAATVTYTVTNTGNARLKAHQRVEVSGPLGLLGHSTTLADLPELLPGSSLTRTVTVHGIWPAIHLTAKVVLEPIASTGSPPLNVPKASSSAGTWGWPIGQLLVLIVVAAAVVGYLWLRRRRARAVEAKISAAVSAALDSADKPDGPGPEKAGAGRSGDGD